MILQLQNKKKKGKPLYPGLLDMAFKNCVSMNQNICVTYYFFLVE